MHTLLLLLLALVCAAPGCSSSAIPASVSPFAGQQGSDAANHMRVMLQSSAGAPVEVSTPAALADAIAAGTLDILITNHMDLTTLDLQCAPALAIPRELLFLSVVGYMHVKHVQMCGNKFASDSFRGALRASVVDRAYIRSRVGFPCRQTYVCEDGCESPLGPIITTRSIRVRRCLP